MSGQIPPLERALITHKAKLQIIEGISKTATDSMQQVLAIDLQAFDDRLDSWATAVPLATTISIYDDQGKQP
ncbi:hypothetical protein ES703_66360 [subsurface metagenome]